MKLSTSVSEFESFRARPCFCAPCNLEGEFLEGNGVLQVVIVCLQDRYAQVKEIVDAPFVFSAFSVQRVVGIALVFQCNVKIRPIHIAFEELLSRACPSRVNVYLVVQEGLCNAIAVPFTGEVE